MSDEKPSVQVSLDGLSIQWGSKALLIIDEDGVSYAVSDGERFRAGEHDIRFDDGGKSLTAAMCELHAAIHQ